MPLSTELVRYNRVSVCYNQEGMLLNWLEPNQNFIFVRY